MLNSRYGRIIWAAMLVLCAGGQIRAQTYAGLVHGQAGRGVMQTDSLEGGTSFSFQDDSRSSRGENLSLVQLQDYGLIGLDAEARQSLIYTFDLIETGSSDPALPPRVGDVFFAMGTGLGAWDAWEANLIAGAGYGGTKPFSDSDAIYAKTTLILSQEAHEETGLDLILEYDGNRPYLEDVPLPGFALRSKVHGASLWVGYPFGKLEGKTQDGWRYDVEYDASRLGASAVVEHDLVDAVSVFALAAHGLISGDDEHTGRGDRVFFSNTRIEAGVRWLIRFGDLGDGFKPVLDLRLAGGYAFDQDFEYGDGIDDAGRSVGVSDEPYVKFTIAGGF